MPREIREDLQSKVVNDTHQDLLILAPRQVGKTQAVIDRILEGEEDTILVMLPTTRNLNLFKDELERVCIMDRVDLPYTYTYSIRDHIGTEKTVIMVSPYLMKNISEIKDFYLDLVIVDEGDYIESSALDGLVYENLIVIGTPKRCNPTMNSAMGMLYYSEDGDIEKAIY